MYSTVLHRLYTLPNILTSSLLISTVSLFGSINTVNAQQNLPICQLPQPGEYVLLVTSPTRNNQSQLRRVLPANTNTTLCRNAQNIVTRIGGFTKIEDANRWAKFIKDSAGLSALITTRPGEATQAQPVYNPQQLGNGYAIIVPYFRRPELANRVQEVVGGDVGFVAYGGRPYLLAVYTTNQKEAYSTLQKLSARGFYPMLVDSSKVMLLRSNVSLR
ncbi:MAG: hypothetical protein QNJ47_23895 [Nostocaceae cyanobacterium]|nr:hypothetical protein [Nostocaceae cyanobacterium]